MNGGFKIGELAERWRVSPDKVRSWIESGELEAVNVARRGAKRPRWIVPRSSVVAFEEQRSNRPEPRPARQGKPRDFKRFVT